MDDTEIHRHIDELVAEEHKLERAHIGQGLSDALLGINRKHQPKH